VGNIHHVSLNQVSLVSEIGASTRVQHDDGLVVDDGCVDSVRNEALGSKSALPSFEFLSSMISLGTIEFKSRIEGGSGYIWYIRQSSEQQQLRDAIYRMEVDRREGYSRAFMREPSLFGIGGKRRCRRSIVLHKVVNGVRVEAEQYAH
jgi:hypothetical protein